MFFPWFLTPLLLIFLNGGGGPSETIAKAPIVKRERVSSFSSTTSGVATVSADGLGGRREVLFRVKPVRDASSPGGQRLARPDDFAFPRSFDTEIHLETVDFHTGELLPDINPGLVDVANRETRNWYLQLLSEIPGPKAESAKAENRLELTRLLKLPD